MRLASLMLTTLLVATGCATIPNLSGTEWTKAGASFYQITLDEMECARDAREAGWTPDLVVGGLVDLVRFEVENLQRKSAFDGCMSKKGYQPT